MTLSISIITVAYNSEKTIADTLDSVATQSYANIEHLIIDGASKDGTLEIVRSHPNPKIHLISEPDKGIYDAMNKGLAQATGELVGFLNSDDFYVDASVLKRVAMVMSNEKLDALYGDVEFFSTSRRDKVVRRYDSGRFTPDRLGWGWMPAHPALFVRRELFERYGLFRSDYRIAGDFEFIARVFNHRELRHRHFPQPLVRMRIGGVSTSGWRATLLLNREMMRACRENSISTNWLKMLSRYPLKLVEFVRG